MHPKHYPTGHRTAQVVKPCNWLLWTTPAEATFSMGITLSMGITCAIQVWQSMNGNRKYYRVCCLQPEMHISKHTYVSYTCLFFWSFANVHAFLQDVCLSMFVWMFVIYRIFLHRTKTAHEISWRYMVCTFRSQKQTSIFFILPPRLKSGRLKKMPPLSLGALSNLQPPPRDGPRLLVTGCHWESCHNHAMVTCWGLVRDLEVEGIDKGQSGLMLTLSVGKLQYLWMVDAWERTSDSHLATSIVKLMANVHRHQDFWQAIQCQPPVECSFRNHDLTVHSSKRLRSPWFSLPSPTCCDLGEQTCWLSGMDLQV